jgi:hypothetical protein
MRRTAVYALSDCKKVNFERPTNSINNRFIEHYRRNWKEHADDRMSPDRIPKKTLKYQKEKSPK